MMEIVRLDGHFGIVRETTGLGSGSPIFEIISDETKPNDMCWLPGVVDFDKLNLG